MSITEQLEVLEPRLVAVDTYTLCHVDDYMQDVSNDCESLAYALNEPDRNQQPSKQGRDCSGTFCATGTQRTRQQNERGHHGRPNHTERGINQ